MLVEIRAGRLARQTVLARRVRGEVMLPCGELFDLLEMDASVEETGRTEVPGGRGWPRIVIDPAGPDAFAGRRPINPDDLRV
ncbi:MAG TPA: hypothetical protein VKU85_04405, partial [bacterium]|nr:hypothetical protein [bacterium]